MDNLAVTHIPIWGLYEDVLCYSQGFHLTDFANRVVKGGKWACHSPCSRRWFRQPMMLMCCYCKWLSAPEATPAFKFGAGLGTWECVHKTIMVLLIIEAIWYCITCSTFPVFYNKIMYDLKYHCQNLLRRRSASDVAPRGWLHGQVKFPAVKCCLELTQLEPLCNRS